MTIEQESGVNNAADSGNGLPEPFIPNQGRGKPEPKVEEAASKPPKEVESAEAEAEGEEKSKPGKKGGFTRKLERVEAELAEARRKLAEQDKVATPKTEDKPDKSDDEPKAEDFETWGDYYKALVKYELKQDKKAAQEESKQEALKRENDERMASYRKKAAEFAANNPDFDDVIEDTVGLFSMNQQQAVIDSEHGPEIAYYLAKNHEEAEKAAAMNLMQFTRFIGRLETRFENQVEESKEEVAKPEVKVSRAAPPITPVRKPTAASSKDPGDLSLRDYEALRRSQHRS